MILFSKKVCRHRDHHQRWKKQSRLAQDASIHLVEELELRGRNTRNWTDDSSNHEATQVSSTKSPRPHHRLGGRRREILPEQGGRNPSSALSQLVDAFPDCGAGHVRCCRGADSVAAGSEVASISRDLAQIPSSTEGLRGLGTT